MVHSKQDIAMNIISTMHHYSMNEANCEIQIFTKHSASNVNINIYSLFKYTVWKLMTSCKQFYVEKELAKIHLSLLLEVHYLERQFWKQLCKGKGITEAWKTRVFLLHWQSMMPLNFHTKRQQVRISYKQASY